MRISKYAAVERAPIGAMIRGIDDLDPGRRGAGCAGREGDERGGVVQQTA
ncbi:hypothetical protein [Streptomyces chartreusis]